ncbi:MAG: iron uptake porin [Myxacorys chilensis ATA2-1-KO14]|jgi:hypothetical protein|nr:iron uptake porin [Myxacorys chilensis ATA2-1-KO14]
MSLIGGLAGAIASQVSGGVIAVNPAIAAPVKETNSVSQSIPEAQSISEAQSIPETVPSVSQLNQASAIDTDSGQVTSVSQLSDVRPTDWAFQALQSLVERYGCIAGYPDRTYRGNRALTRYEFAAGLNACLDRVNELIAASTSDLVRKEDLATLQKLQDEFVTELAALRGRMDALETRTTTLEKQQFSTTTKLQGEAIFSLASAYGAVPNGQDANVAFNNRVRLNLKTSFTGKDALITGLQAQNFGASGLVGSGSSLAQTLGYADPVFGSSSNVKLSYGPQFPTADPSTLTAKGADNSLILYKLLYVFPVANKLTAFVGTNAEVSDAFPSILPFASEGQGAISRFAALPAAQRVSGGTSQTGLAAAAGFIFNISDAIDLRALYGSVNANLPANNGLAGGTPLGAGVFGGSYVAAAQLTVKPSPAIDIGLNYAHSYHQINILGTGLSSSDIGAIALPGGFTVANLDEGIQLNTVSASVAFRLSPKLTLAGSYTYIFSDLVDVNASTNFNSWLVGLHVKDIFKKGNSAGITFGQPLKRVQTSGLALNPENRIPYHLEGYFNFQVSDNISVTPGVFAVFNPEGSSANNTAIVPVIRTTFSF